LIALPTAQMEQKMHLVITGGKILLLTYLNYINNTGPFGEEDW
jgi:hypothetical protein